MGLGVLGEPNKRRVTGEPEVSRGELGVRVDMVSRAEAVRLDVNGESCLRREKPTLSKKLATPVALCENV